jgi:hypothetical protein
MNPTATHVVELGQETPESEFSPEGASWESQLEPSVVWTICDPPTAVHADAEKQEIDSAGNAAS